MNKILDSYFEIKIKIFAMNLVILNWLILKKQQSITIHHKIFVKFVSNYLNKKTCQM